ncbi:hypothetical protein JJ685_05355 [Ramlibacter monticola]|uniref:Uncharacterized protein n=1 Tax=Ramlibacter monticola TaxID=1926872 RepID=A0A936YZ10_9BURK|nr:hypothetical protein [Ramlibacter monticola]MBL0390565.1 hypothetical protein [Ramlibacter monticola]
MTLSFEPALPDRFATLRAFVAHRASVTHKSMKTQAADMDMAPSTLTRKLNPADGDTQRFNVDDFESWLQSTGEAASVIEYLCAKYMDTPEARRARLLAKLEGTVPELLQMLAQLKESAA